MTRREEIQENMQDTTTSGIIVSEATEAQIGPDFINFIEKIAAQGAFTQPAAIIGEQDVTSEGPFGWLADQARLSRAFNAAGYQNPNDITRSITQNQIDVTKNQHSAFALSFKNNDVASQVLGDDIHGGIMGFDNYLDLDEIKNFIKFDKKLIPGTAEDYERYVLLHEGVHMDHSDLNILTRSAEIDPKNLSEEDYSKLSEIIVSSINGDISKKDITSLSEYEADTLASQYYANAYREGLVENMEVPYVFRAKRAIDTIMGDDGNGEYALNGITFLPGEDGLLPDRPKISEVINAKNQIEAGREQFIYEIGENLVDPQMIEFETIGDLLFYHSEKFGSEAEAGESFKHYYDLKYESDNVTAEQVQDFLDRNPVPDNLKEQYDSLYAENLKYEISVSGESAIYEDPTLAYEKARELLARGEFDDNPYAKRLMENFVDGAQRYAPERFGVAPDDQPTEKPDIVAKLEKEYAPQPERQANIDAVHERPAREVTHANFDR